MIVIMGLYYRKDDGTDREVWQVNASGTPEDAAKITPQYRTITFKEPPSGKLLTWLQANAVKQ